jgi:DeoR/GlpR family transcriptional regulator of sugar metabolism
MLIAQRQARLQELVAQRGMCDLDTLTSDLNVSQSTVRRDLDALQQRGLLKRTHGGVIWIGERTSAAHPYVFDETLADHLDAKRLIAQAAKKLIHNNQTLIFDGGTTIYSLAKELIGTPVQIVTNSLPIANLLLNDENVELILTGGLMYPRYGVLLGSIAENMLPSIHANMLFMSCAGIHAAMLYNRNLLLVSSQKRMMQQAQEIVLLVDSTKFGHQALAPLCTLNEIDTVVSDSALCEEFQKQVKDAGCKLILAEPDSPGR